MNQKRKVTLLLTQCEQYRSQGLLFDEEACIQQILQEQPKNLEAIRRLASVRFSTGHYVYASALYYFLLGQVNRQSVHWREDWLSCIRSHFRAGLFDKSEAILSRFQGLGENIVGIVEEYVEFLMDEGKYGRAADFLDSVDDLSQQVLINNPKWKLELLDNQSNLIDLAFVLDHQSVDKLKEHGFDVRGSEIVVILNVD